ncbi:MAG: histidine kinase [Paenibacillus sp.]|jgi:HD-GYP domain-containing protein (c-di-GMP phosphodiesterase class II)|nr:histidine kinase [Paenibacillus sp.]
MRLVPIEWCRPGMRLAKKVFNEEGLVLLAEHVELTQRMVERLALYGIPHLYIEDERTDDVVIRDAITVETRRMAMGVIRTNFKRVMLDSLPRRAAYQPYMGKSFMEALRMIIDDLSQNPGAMIMLTDISITDMYLYQHSLNVCIYATMLGLADGYSKNDLTMLGLGALLHDIGKTKLPTDILKKPGKLLDSEFETMKRHTEYGYRLLKDEPNIPLLSAHCALQHHERLDGSGYPRGIRGEEIHDFAKWIGLVDSYDAMTTNRVYRAAMLPHQAMEVLYTGADSLYEKSKVEHFRDRVAIYPLGATVTLNTGETGVVVDVNSQFAQRPIVRILEDQEGQTLKEPYEIDLSTHLSVIVTGIGNVQVAEPIKFT